MSVAFRENEIAAREIRSHNLEFKEEFVSPAEIDWEKSQANQSRLNGKALDEDVVYRYQQDQERGHAFPALTGYRNSVGKIVLMDGNHSGYAATLVGNGDSRLLVYVVQTDDQLLIDLLTRKLNRFTGPGQAPDDSLQHAIYMVERKGMSPADAAVEFGLKPKRLAEKIKVLNTRRMLESHKIRTSKINQGVMTRLAKIHNTNHLLAAANAVLSTPITLEAIKTMVADVNAAQTEADGLRVIAACASEAAKQPVVAGKRVKSKDAELRRILTTLRNYAAKHQTLDRLGITSDLHVSEFLSLWVETRDATNRLFDM